MDEQGDSVHKGTMAAGLSVVGVLVTGTFGLLGSVALAEDGQGGMYLMAAAVAFGLLANAVFRR